MKIKVGVLAKVERVIDVDSEDLERLEDYWRNHWFKPDFDTEWMPEAEARVLCEIEETIQEELTSDDEVLEVYSVCDAKDGMEIIVC